MADKLVSMHVQLGSIGFGVETQALHCCCMAAVVQMNA